MGLTPYQKLVEAKERLSEYDDEFFPTDPRPSKLQLRTWQDGRKAFEKAVSNAHAIWNASRNQIKSDSLSDFQCDPET